MIDGEARERTRGRETGEGGFSVYRGTLLSPAGKTSPHWGGGRGGEAATGKGLDSSKGLKARNGGNGGQDKMTLFFKAGDMLTKTRGFYSNGGTPISQSRCCPKDFYIYTVQNYLQQTKVMTQDHV